VGENQISAIFHPRSPYLKKYRLALEAMWELEHAGISLKKWLHNRTEWVIPHFQNLAFANWLPLFLRDSTGDINPDADPETSTVDGYVGRAGEDGTWANIRDGAGNESGDTDANDTAPLIAKSAANNYEQLRRCIYLYNTSTIPGTATIQSGTHSVYGTAKGNTIDDADTDLVASNPTSNTALANGDYGTLGTTKFATAIAYASWSTSGYNDWTLNSDGLAAINAGGISDFGTRLDVDTDDTPPGGGANENMFTQGNFADNASNEPKLNVTYSTVDEVVGYFHV
jgi:hypothetical protein